jgi:hypothetical protein
MINKKSVMVLPSTVFDFPGNFFRVGLGRKNLKGVLEKLEEYVKEYF